MDDDLMERMHKLREAQISEAKLSRTTKVALWKAIEGRLDNVPPRARANPAWWFAGAAGFAAVAVGIGAFMTGAPQKPGGIAAPGNSPSVSGYAPLPQGHPTAPRPQSSWHWHPIGIGSWHMVSATEGVATDSGARVFETTLGGRRWNWTGTIHMPKAPPASTSIFRAFGMQDMVQVDAGTLGNKAVVQTTVTHDGGNRWQTFAVTVPHENWQTGPNMYSTMLEAGWANDQDGVFLVGSPAAHASVKEVKVYVTHNSGRHWALIPGPVPGFGQVSMSMPGRVWLTTESGALFELNTARDRWTPISLGSQKVSGPVEPHFWHNGEDGVVLTRASQGDVGVWTTEDGGKAWHQTSVLPTTKPAHLYVANARDWWIWMAPTRITSKSPVGSLWRTRDGGRHWTDLGTPKGLSQKNPASLDTAQFVNGSVGFATFIASTTPQITAFDMTTDGGRTWSQYTPEARLPQDLLTMYWDGKWWG